MDQCPVQGESKTLIRLTHQKPEISAGSMGHLARKGLSLAQQATESKEHDSEANVLPELDIGQDVRVAGQRDKNWQPGTEVNKLSDRSFTVQFNGEVIRRNRVDLRAKHDSGAVENTPDLQEAEDDLLVGGPPTLSKASVKVSDQTNTSMPQTTNTWRNCETSIQVQGLCVNINIFLYKCFEIYVVFWICPGALNQ